MANELKQLDTKYKIGFSKIYSDLSDTQDAYKEAKFSLEVGFEVKNNAAVTNVKSFDDLLIYYVLDEISEHKQLVKLYNDTL